MAKVKLNPALDAIHGHVGDLVFKRFAGREIVGKMPDRTGIVPSADQLAQQDKFRLAALYGKAVLTDPQTKQVYEDAAARKGIPAFALTVADFLNAPAIDEIDLSVYTGKTGDKIAVHASDDGGQPAQIQKPNSETRTSNFQLPTSMISSGPQIRDEDHGISRGSKSKSKIKSKKCPMTTGPKLRTSNSQLQKRKNEIQTQPMPACAA